MSSIYRVICMSHDPGMELMEHEWQSGNDGRAGVMYAIQQIGNGEKSELDAHKKCDLLVGRYSYPIVEIGCPQSHPARPTPPCRHNREYWVETQWIRLLWAAWTSSTEPGNPELPALKQAVERFQHSCWTPQRLMRLAPLMDW